MTEFKAIVGIWLLAQIVIVPFIIFDDGDGKVGLAMDFGTLVLLIVEYFGLKLIGV